MSFFDRIANPKWAALLLLAATAACSAADDEQQAEDDLMVPEGIGTLAATTEGGSKTYFSSGPVDLTTYTGAGEEEWTHFEDWYRKRHSRSSQTDAYDQVAFELQRRTPLKSAVAEAVALRAYTADVEWFREQSPERLQDYKVVNTALREAASLQKKGESLDLLEGFIKSAASGMKKYPSYSQPVFRRLHLSNCEGACIEKFAARYAPGKSMIEPAFLSASASEKETCQYAGQISYVIDPGSLGRDISPVAADSKERVILFPPGTKFRVTAVERDAPSSCEAGSGKYVQTKEISISLQAVAN